MYELPRVPRMRSACLLIRSALRVLEESWGDVLFLKSKKRRRRSTTTALREARTELSITRALPPNDPEPNRINL
jgi:hypothetical protein